MRSRIAAACAVALLGLGITRATPPSHVSAAARITPERHTSPGILSPHQGNEGPPPLAVDGAQNPELVPDYVAHRHLAMALAIPDKPSSTDTLRQQALFAQIGLAPADRDSLAASLLGLRAVLDSGNNLRRNPSADPAALRAYQQVRQQALRAATQRMKDAVSPEGRIRLERFVDRMKYKIRIYGTVIPEP